MIDKAWVRFPLGGLFVYFFTNQLVISLNFEVIILLLKYIQVGASQLTLFGRLVSVQKWPK